MNKTNFIEIKQRHFEKHCAALNDLSVSTDVMLGLNSALLDKNIRKINTYKKNMDSNNYKYTLQNNLDLIKNKSQLKIVYLILSTNIAGGTRILIEQSNNLVEKGHDVLIYSHCPKPNWIECKGHFFLVHPDNYLHNVIPSADVVITGYWSLTAEALKINAPLKYHFSQGDFDVFDFDSQTPYIKTAIYTAYQLPLKILTVSDIMQQKIQTLFDRKSIKIPNAIDNAFFEGKVDLEKENNPLEILLVGTDTHKFKGFETIINVLHYLFLKGYQFNVNWITPVKLKEDYSKLGFAVSEHISPTRDHLINIYRNCDIFICGSLYESFGLPALEAMASGTAVISSANGGTLEYAEDGTNCLLFEPGNMFMLTNRLQTLLDEPDLRLKLRSNGINTAKKFKWNRSITKLEHTFMSPMIQAFRT